MLVELAMEVDDDGYEKGSNQDGLLRIGCANDEAIRRIQNATKGRKDQRGESTRRNCPWEGTGRCDVLLESLGTDPRYRDAGRQFVETDSQETCPDGLSVLQS